MGELALELEMCDAQRAGQLVAVVRDIFAAVFAEPPYSEGPEDVAQWLEDYTVQRTRPGFALVLARLAGTPVGFAYGYTMTPEMSRWQKIVEPIRSELPGASLATGAIFTLMEFAVLAHCRSRGVGRAALNELLNGRTESLALLTVREDADTALAAYRAWGWRKVGYRPRSEAAGYEVFVREL